MFLVCIYFIGHQRFESIYGMEPLETHRHWGGKVRSRPRGPKAWKHRRGASAIANSAALALLLAEAELKS